MRYLAALLLLTGCSSAAPAASRPLMSSPAPGDEINGHVKEAAGAELGSLVELYKWFHENAELSLKEEKTAAKFAAEVRAAGWTVTEKIGGTGVVAVLKNGDGPLVFARIDMDGLPVKEETGLPYASKGDAMHACGHDSHLAIGVGTARILSKLKSRWAGTMVLIGQPAEEIGRGAEQMLADPKFHELIPGKPVACLSVHDMTEQAGTIGVCPGFASANVDSIDITLYGEGGHGAWPHLTVDPIVIGAEVVLSLQTIVSRKIKPGTKAVVTVGSFHAGTKHNVIGNEAKLQLTVRSYEEDVRKMLLAEIRHICESVAAAHHSPKKPFIKYGEAATDACYFEPAFVGRLQGVFERLLGKEKIWIGEPMMGGEDFGRFPKHFGVPGLQFRVGGARPGHDSKIGLHSSKWAVDPEPTILTGTQAFSRGCLELLGTK
jgi:hippurate hydrolase